MLDGFASGLSESTAPGLVALDPACLQVTSALSAISTTKIDVGDVMARGASVDPRDEAFWEGRDFFETPVMPYNVENGTLVIPVSGVLLPRLDYVVEPYVTGYNYITAAVARGLRDSNVRQIALHFNTPGGLVPGMFEAAEFIYSSRAKKPIYGVIDTMAASAGYILASATGEIVLSESAMVGSIGTFIRHVSLARALENAGIEVTYISAGEGKLQGVPEKPLSDEDQEKYQARVDKMRALFVERVAEYRGLDESWRKSITAETFSGEDAIAAELADTVAPDLWGYVKGGENTMPKIKDDKAVAATGTDEDFEARVEAAVTKAVASAKAEAAEAAKAEERKRFLDVLGSEEAKANVPAALKMLATDMEAAVIIDVLKELPAPAKAETPAGASHFEAAMNAEGSPAAEVGLADKTKDDDPEARISAAERIAGIYARAVGKA